MWFRYRSLCKSLPTGSYAGRGQQFQVICQLVLAVSLNSPVISIDCKKKVVLGQLHRAGKCATLGRAHAYDHHYQHLAQGKVVAHGIYDLQRNEGYITIGTSHETAAFVADSLRWWWETFGIHGYPDAQNILILCDAGGANSSQHHSFKNQMLLLAQTIGTELINRAMRGTVLYDYGIVQTLIGQTSTQTGLKVFPRIVHQHYPIGIKTAKSEIDYSRLNQYPATPDLAYRIAALNDNLFWPRS